MDTPFQTITYLEDTFSPETQLDHSLVILPQESRISYAVLSPGGQLVASKTFFNEQKLASSVFFRLVLEREKIISTPFASRTLLSATTQFTWLPHAVIREGEDDIFRMSRILLDESAFRQEVYHIPLPEMEAQVVLIMPLPIRYLWDEYLSEYHLSHISLPLAQMMRRLAREAPSHLLLQWFDSFILIGACKAGELVFCNAFPIRAEMDIVYFLHSIRQVTGLLDEASPIYAMGEFDREGLPFRNLQQYLPNIKIAPWEQAALPESAAHTPYWKYGFLSL